ncbi:hypothetical protein [Algoriphagus hitonicola]|uniref:Uncharacterized protein n=1 Tax=Algoriphagus hitonicola TaxID=435880 RepID=A0A1I2VY50_9BACT|nr:hypothetical protein [Algoriphagus hitonicola]SFG92241.1 hypothetical protein SAMN04487988_110140 [Algoriphagus hitonicola]
MDGLMWHAISGGVIALLLSIIAFFLKLLVQDIKSMSTEISKIKEALVRMETELAMVKYMLLKYPNLINKKIMRLWGSKIGDS